MSSHVSNGKCPGCERLFDLFPSFHVGLRAWFERVQLHVPEAHISCAGRGPARQNELFNEQLSRARWGESAHNYGAAIDIFRQTPGLPLYDIPWFQGSIIPFMIQQNQTPNDFQIVWYGSKGAKYFELPHFEIKGWESLGLKLVDTTSK